MPRNNLTHPSWQDFIADHSSPAIDFGTARNLGTAAAAAMAAAALDACWPLPEFPAGVLRVCRLPLPSAAATIHAWVDNWQQVGRDGGRQCAQAVSGLSVCATCLQRSHSTLPFPLKLLLVSHPQTHPLQVDPDWLVRWVADHARDSEQVLKKPLVLEEVCLDGVLDGLVAGALLGRGAGVLRRGRPASGTGCGTACGCLHTLCAPALASLLACPHAAVWQVGDPRRPDRRQGGGGHPGGAQLVPAGGWVACGRPGRRMGEEQTAAAAPASAASPSLTFLAPAPPNPDHAPGRPSTPRSTRCWPRTTRSRAPCSGSGERGRLALAWWGAGPARRSPCVVAAVGPAA